METWVWPCTGPAAGRSQRAFPWLERLAGWLAAWAWFSAYARRHRLALVLDLGWWFFGLWPLLATYYLFKTQGRRALIPIAAYLALRVVSFVLGWLIGVIASRP